MAVRLLNCPGCGQDVVPEGTTTCPSCGFVGYSIAPVQSAALANVDYDRKKLEDTIAKGVERGVRRAIAIYFLITALIAIIVAIVRAS